MTTTTRLSILVGLVALLAGLARLGDLGPTWDLARGEYAYAPALFEWATGGDAGLLDVGWKPRRVAVRAPAPVFEAGVPLAAISPPAALAAGASLRVVWTEAGWLTPVAALLLPALVAGALLFALASWIAARGAGGLAGAAAAVGLLAAPRVVGAAGYDVRHLPVATLTLALLALVVVAPRRSASSVIGDAREPARSLSPLPVGVLLGLAVAWRPTSLVWLVLLPLLAAVDPRTRAPVRAWGLVVLVAAPVALAASPDLWLHPLEAWRDRVAWRASAPLPAGPSVATLFAVTTPLPLLVLGLVGLATSRARGALRVALGVAVVVPLVGATLAPQWWPARAAVVEAAAPLAVLAGFAVVALRDLWCAWVAGGAASSALGALLALALFVPGLRATLAAWPHADRSFAHVGLGEAQRRGWPGAADDQAATVWGALSWLGEHAELGADVLVLVGERLAATAAPVALRPDLDLVTRRGLLPDPPPPLYVVMPLHPGGDDDLAAEVRRVGTPVHTRQVEGALLLEIWRIDARPDAREVVKAWRDAISAPAEAAAALVAAWADSHPGVARDLDAWLERAGGVGPRALLGLRVLVPDELRPRVDEALHAVAEAP